MPKKPKITKKKEPIEAWGMFLEGKFVKHSFCDALAFWPEKNEAERDFLKVCRMNPELKIRRVEIRIVE